MTQLPALTAARHASPTGPNSNQPRLCNAIACCRDDPMTEVGVRGVEHGDQVGEQPEPVGELD